MENVADALKMSGAALLFVLAFSITMFMFNKAKTATEAVLDNLQLSSFFTRVDPLNNNETRKVGIESIIPTLYRYFQSDENPTIIIRDKDKNVLQIFDTEIETIAHNNFETYGTTEEYISNYYQDLKAKYGDINGVAYLYGAPWVNQNSRQYYFERINAYVFGSPCKHIPSLNTDETKSIYSTKNNTLIKYKNNTFIESYIEYNTNGHVEKDEYGDEVVTIPPSTKVIITYTLLN